MNRRSLLGSLALLAGSGLAGCTGDLAGTADDDGTRTTDPTETTRPTPDGCPTTMGYDVERPDDLTKRKTEVFVTEYEEAYTRNHMSEDAKSATVDVRSPSAERHGRGFAVEVTTEHSVERQSDDSTTVMYGDDFGTEVLYYVDDVLVRRRESPAENADPRKGVLLECEGE